MNVDLGNVFNKSALSITIVVTLIYTVTLPQVTSQRKTSADAVKSHLIL